VAGARPLDEGSIKRQRLRVDVVRVTQMSCFLRTGIRWECGRDWSVLHLYDG